MTRVAVTSRSFSRHPVLRQELLARYPDTTFNDDGLSLCDDDLIAFLSGHNKAITALEPLTDEVFSSLPDLKVIGKYGVGFDMIDLSAMKKHGVALGWTGGVNRRSVAELVIAFAISLLRFVPQTNAEVRAGTWRQAVGRQLSDRTVGIVGCGHVGKDLAKILKHGFGCHVLVHDILGQTGFCRENKCEQVDLDNLVAASDIISLHLPLDNSTRNIFDAKLIARMPSGSILINTARGGLVDEAALKRALTDGPLAAAAFDVFAVEPPEDPTLLNLPNFMVTPHIGGSAEEAILAMGRAAIDGLDTNQIPSPGIFPPGQW